MYSDEQLDSAVTAGALSAEAVAALREHVASLSRDASIDEERFRLISGFNDIFVVIACLLLLTSVAWIGAAAEPWIGALATSGVAWALAEFFVRRQRMALPAIVLLLAFVGGISFGLLLALGISGASLLATSSVTALAAWLHWMRFHVPITVAAGVAAVVGGFIATLVLLVPSAKDWFPLLLFIAGAATFGYALYWDASDAKRLTRRSDIAFWLHLLAAPFLVHPVFAMVDVFSGKTNAIQILAIVALYAGIALVSLTIDRRALMVSALGYVLYAFTRLFEQAGFVSFGFAITALVLGSALLVLSAFWHRSRAFVVQLLPTAIQTRLASLH